MSEKTRRIALLGLLAALCFGLSYIELMLPALPVGVPGIKAGLANICVVAALYLLGAREAAAVNLIRIALNWLLFGSFTGLLYSLAGGALSFAAMLLLKKSGAFSPIGVSALGGAAHNIGQICVAALLTGTPALMFYLPALLIFGTAAGALNGLIFTAIQSRLKPRGKQP